MATFNQGDTVVVATRDQTNADIKSGLYFGHYAGLTGSILKVYGEEASVLVDRASLPADVLLRHEEGESAMRRKWMDSLSEEARGRLGEREKNFALNYAVLVSVGDLTAQSGASGGSSIPVPAPVVAPTKEAKQTAQGVAKAARAIDPLTGESDVANADDVNAGGAVTESMGGTDSAAKRATQSDLDAAEAKFLAERAANDGSGDDAPKKRGGGKAGA